MIWGSNLGRVKRYFFLFSKMSRPALGPTQLLIQWVIGFFCPRGGGSSRGMMLATHLHLVSRLRMSGANPSIYLSIHLSNYLSIHPSIHPPTHPPTHPPVCLSIHLSTYIYIHTHTHSTSEIQYCPKKYCHSGIFVNMKYKLSGM